MTTMGRERKPNANAKLKLLPDDVQEALWYLLHPEDPERKPMTLEALCGHIMREHGVSVGITTVSEWRSWYGLKRRMDRAAERALQTALELERNSDLTPADIERAAQTVFTAEALEAGDIAGYVALANLRLSARQLDMDERRVAVLEKKAAQAEAAEQVSKDGSLNEEQKAARMKEIFGF